MMEQMLEAASRIFEHPKGLIFNNIVLIEISI